MKTTGNPNTNWLQDAQDLMIDVGKLNQMGQLTGKLYKLGEKAAEKSDLGLRDEDAIAFFDAFKQSLEFNKHGNAIRLPLRLHSHLDLRLRSLLADTA